jgi:membrane protein required for colicin V production
MSWHWVDSLILGIIGLSVITGLFRGFVKELIALCVWILAIWLAYRYSSYVEHWIQPYIQDHSARAVVAFIAILLATLLAGGLFNALLSFILHRSGLGGTDRLLGMGFGFIRGVFIVAFIMLVLQITSMPHQEIKEQSRLYAKFDPLVTWMSEYKPGWIKKDYNSQPSVTLIDEIAPVEKAKKKGKLQINGQ